MLFSNAPRKGKVLFLHGWLSDGSYKTTTLTCMGYDVSTPKLSDWAFNVALQTAQEAHDTFKPDVIIGSSRGAAVAMCLKSDRPLILIAPAWRHFGHVNKVTNPHSIVVHSPKDDVVPYEDSVALCGNSPGLKLFAVGDDHRMIDKRAWDVISSTLEELLAKSSLG